MRLPLVALCLLACACKPAAEAPARPAIQFREAAGTGFAFTHNSGASGQYYMTEIMGAGVALFDFDSDGRLDIYCVQSAGEGKLFRNESEPGGRLRYRDVTAGSGLSFRGYGMGAATGDYNNDGRTDLLVTGFGARSLYRNEGNGKFREVSFPQPANVWSTSASFTDYDRDGLLDVVVLSYVNFSEAANKVCHAPTGERDYCTPKAYSPVSARLYHNDGGDRFRDVTTAAGLDQALGPGLGVVAADVNGDDWPDLFVANDTAQNHLWINQRNGKFAERGLQAGVAFSEDGLAKAGMGVALGDVDNDGAEDLLVVNLMREGATLFRKTGVDPQGIPFFEDATRRSGIFLLTLPYTGFGAGWVDFDRDGLLDLFIANGAVTLREDLRGTPNPFRERNLVLRNTGGKFIDETATAGDVLQLLEVTRGAAFGDLDNDGDEDVVITNNNGPARILENLAPGGRSLSVELVGRGVVTRDAYGALVTLVAPGNRRLPRRVHTDSSYCSASDKRLHFANVEGSKIEVRWPDGTVQRIEAGASRSLRIQHP